MLSEFETCSRKFRIVKPPQREGYTEFTHLGQSPDGEINIAVREYMGKIYLPGFDTVSLFRPVVYRAVQFKGGIPDWENTPVVTFGSRIDPESSDPSWIYSIAAMNNWGDCLLLSQEIALSGLKEGQPPILRSEYGISWLRDGTLTALEDGHEGIAISDARTVIARDLYDPCTPRIALDATPGSTEVTRGKLAHWGKDLLADYVCTNRKGDAVLSQAKVALKRQEFQQKEFAIHFGDDASLRVLKNCVAVSDLSNSGLVCGIAEAADPLDSPLGSENCGAYWHPSGAHGMLVGDHQEQGGYYLPLSAVSLPRLADRDPDLHVLVGKKSPDPLVVAEAQYPDELRAELDRPLDCGTAQIWFALGSELMRGYPLVGTDLNTRIVENIYQVESAHSVTTGLLMLATARNKRGALRDVLLVPVSA